jgi:hypothetical protein
MWHAHSVGNVVKSAGKSVSLRTRTLHLFSSTHWRLRRLLERGDGSEDDAAAPAVSRCLPALVGRFLSSATGCDLLRPLRRDEAADGAWELDGEGSASAASLLSLPASRWVPWARVERRSCCGWRPDLEDGS